MRTQLTGWALVLSILVAIPSAVRAQVVTDDFSTPTIDLTKWAAGNENFVRRISGGMLESSLHRLGSRVGNNLRFANPDSITSYRADVTVTEATQLGAAANLRARLHGNFYNDGTSSGPGDQTGDIVVSFELRADQFAPAGSISVIAAADRCTNATCNNATSLVSDRNFFPAVPIGSPHTMTIEWDGNRTFTFRFDGLLPFVFDTGIAPAGPGRGMFHTLNTNAGSVPTTAGAGGSIRALFDNVHLNGVPYDDFDNPGGQLDSTKWLRSSLELVKRNTGGAFESALGRFGSPGSNDLTLLNPTAFARLEVDVTVVALRNSGAEVLARVQGFFYNVGTPGAGFAGDIVGGIGIIARDDTTLHGVAFVARCLNDNCNLPAEIEELFRDETSFAPVSLGSTHQLTVTFDGTTFTFGFDTQTVSFAPGMLAPNVAPANVPSRSIGTRVSGIDSAAEGGFIHATFDNFLVSRLATPVVVVASGDGASEAPVLSADGRYVVLASRATNLVAAGCVTGERQVYRVDRQTRLTECVSRTVGGVPGDGASGDPVVSADGRFVTYPTLAQNLAPECANGVQQIVQTDMDTKATVCVSRGATGPGSAGSRQPTINGDGTLVAFVTPSADLDPACANGDDQVHLRNLAFGTTRCMSVDALGRAGTGPSVEPRLSADGTQLVYATQATNLVFPGGVLLARAPGGRAIGGEPLAQRERLAQVMRQSTLVAGAVAELMSRGPGGALGNGASRRPAVSDDGQTVAFDSTATNLVSECATGVAQVLVASPGGMQCASRNDEGAPGDAPSTAPAISGAGTLVVWVSLAQNLARAVTGPPDLSQVLQRSLAGQNAMVELLSQVGGTAGNGASQRPSIDRTGQLTVFQTSATNLVSGDTNGQDDVLLVAIPLVAPAVLDRVSITAPPNGSVLPLAAPTLVTVMWTAIDGATQYALEFTGADRVFANPNGTAPDGVNGFGGAGGAVVVPTTSFSTTLGPGFPAGLYQARVVGLTAGFQLGGRFSDAVTLALGAIPPGNGRVRITQPGPGSVLTIGTPVTFVWDALAAVASYFFEFTGPGGTFADPNGTGPDPGNVAGGGVIIPATGFTTLVPALPPGVYQVRVIGRTAAGAFVGTFSDALTLTIQ